jgi:hypothetical protein
VNPGVRLRGPRLLLLPFKLVLEHDRPHVHVKHRVLRILPEPVLIACVSVVEIPQLIIESVRAAERVPERPLA